MSCLRLSLKLPPARKAWKIFTSKLQIKLPKFHRRPNKLTYGQPPRTHRPRALAPRKSLSAAGARGKIRPHQPHRYVFKKKSKPVYVDKLFKETNASYAAVSVSGFLDCKKGGVRFIEKSSERDVPSGPEVASTSCGAVDDHDRMWESVGLASPLMRNIDERAEEFIARFRAEMKAQEAIARRQSS